MLHIPAAKMKEADMRSRSERGNRKMDEVQGWRSKQVNYKKRGRVCVQRPTRRRSSEEETAAKTLSSQRHCWGQGGRNNQNLSGNYKIVKLCPLCLSDYDTSATRVCSSVRTTEHCPATEMGKISCVKAPNWWSAKGKQKKSVELMAREQEKEPLRTTGCDWKAHK